MEGVRKLTLLEAVHFAVEPLDCNADPTARWLLAALSAWGRAPTFPWSQPLLEAVCHLACDLRVRPALVLSLIAIICVVLTITLRNACVHLLRWYAAARGSAFVAVATRALRELHASGALFELAGDSADPACMPRPAAAHRWYTPPGVTAPVVCCGCFQPVVVAQGAEGHAQCCELCGMVAHGSCIKAVPHNCRLLSLAAPPTEPPPPPPARGGGAAPSAAPPPPLPHDWRPAGTTLDLILPPADSEMLLTGGDSTAAAAGSGGGGAAVTHGSVSASSAACSSHGPPSLCLYCGEPCEVGLLAVEPVWRCGGCRRFAHVQCWSSLHPGALSAATRAALEGQALEAEEITAVGGGSPRGASYQWDHQANGDGGQEAGSGGSGGDPLSGSAAAGGGGGGRRSGGGGTDHAGVHGHSARALRPAEGPASAGGGSGGGKGAAVAAAAASAAPAAATASGTWDWSRRCRSLPNIAGHGAGGGGSRGSGGGGSGGRVPGGGDANHHPHSGAGDGAAAATSPPRAAAGGSAAAAAAKTFPAVCSGRGSGSMDLQKGYGGGEVAVRGSGDLGRLARLDRCDPQASLGLLGAMVLPPTAVLPTTRRTTSIFTPVGKAAAPPAGSAPAAAATAGSNGVASGGGGVRSGGRKKQSQMVQQQQQQQGQQQGRSSLRQRAQKWYRSHAAGWSLSSGAAADAAAPERWRHFRVWVGALPAGCRPLLVFINPRSGPQAGEQLRRQLLQLLHPMQVVDLEREAPGAALRCWWGVPGLRVLVVGGDGTAGWVLGEMEALAAEMAATAAAAAAAAGQQGGGNGECDESGSGAAVAPLPPPPPPLTVLPLGTGNDLARVLGWGGGLAALDARGGVAAALGEVASAAPTPLDRWALSIATTPPEPQKRRSSFLPRRRQPAGAASTPKGQPPAVVQVKVFNNYLGVGIDSWCALEFHRMRERYPGWFKSQLGNKMWYTGVGARDLLARSCVDLPSRLQLVCDGVPVELPPATQGILLLNITSYMGGVDLWGNGVSQQQQQQQQQQIQMQQQQIQMNGGAVAAGGLQQQQPPLQNGMAAAGGGGGGGSRNPAGTEARSPDRPPGAQGPPGAAGAGATAAAGAAGASSGAAARRGGSGSPSGGRLSSEVTTPPPPLQPQLQQPPPPQHHAHPEVPQSISDGVLEVVVVYGAVHLGQLQVGLARATRLCQCRTAVITTRQALPMQVDGEPWMQSPAQLSVSLKGSALLLRRLDLSSATSRLTAAVGEVLDGAVARGTITPAQRQTLGAQLAQRLGAPHAV
ncbi:hypothetical protein PLESTB_000346100 [Pleodorina starrii]|uniref:Diacylglycerol kinase n=1 Tax=Pleodorina starrii TaxID=330485 RepID=A0A9W6BEJ1_9CHLO|nr:hypothetical protein PLESTM_000048600 [Pleodorina starrii]GLC50137.1 hypothetical protein PLESTB_000346100 [Pleodorina starrii]GLC73082.1 hypothetical protein PLESTF_001330200 [Pleodorina starrii]